MVVREVVMTKVIVRALAAALLLTGCSPPKATQETATPSGAGELAAAERAPAIEVVAVNDDTPAGGDGPPRLTLAFRFADGSRRPIAGEATAYVPFRRGVALVDLQRQLVLVTADGARSVLAREAGAPPARGPSGELAYVARHDLAVEVHVLEEDGRDRIVARGLGSAGVLAPQRDGRLFFVATPSGGGVAGLWLAGGEHEDARCLTNCELATGAPLSERFMPLPRDAQSIHASASVVEWDAADGTRRSVALAPALPAEPGEHGGAVREDGRTEAP
jgi:hypothetical protein